jgi:hypothetical protein
VNIEQAINPSVGFFLRAMKADGKTETYAFTEADGSLSTGLVFKGGLWGRADDVVGLAFMHNTLSPERRGFLAAGGMSYFIGDASVSSATSLAYKPEQVLEVFYNFQMTRLITSAFKTPRTTLIVDRSMCTQRVFTPSSNCFSARLTQVAQTATVRVGGGMPPPTCAVPMHL